jgi:hypothetical protein
VHRHPQPPALVARPSWMRVSTWCAIAAGSHGFPVRTVAGREGHRAFGVTTTTAAIPWCGRCARWCALASWELRKCRNTTRLVGHAGGRGQQAGGSGGADRRSRAARRALGDISSHAETWSAPSPAWSRKSLCADLSALPAGADDTPNIRRGFGGRAACGAFAGQHRPEKIRPVVRTLAA